MELFGWAAAGNINIECLGRIKMENGCSHYSHLLNKFPEDGIYGTEGACSFFLDGYVTNKEQIAAERGKSWKDAVLSADWAQPGRFLEGLRGGFCGYTYDARKERLLFFTDQMGNKAIYYYIDETGWLLSNCLQYMVRVLKANGKERKLDETAVKYMLTCGFMLDGSTWVEGIRRLLPGQYAELSEGGLDIRSYYRIPDHTQEVSEKEAIERIDSAFRQAVRREFQKDREYGYRHLVDLSGGLDSRMVTWVAHEEGYTDQVNVTYCRSGYADQKIAEQIAGHLGHEYLFKSLDDAGWMYDVDEMTCRNNGAAVGLGMTGGNRLLQELNTGMFGIEHTGMVGDAILSTFYTEEDFSHGKARFGLNQYSDMVSYSFDERILEEYPTQEIFAIYTRGILGAQSSYITRQHYVETASPFLDVDFLNAVMTLPFACRKQHKIYLRWIEECYPGAAEYGWEKWGGVKPKNSQIPLRRIRTVQRLAGEYVCRVLHRPVRDSMNPMDYWYRNRKGIKEYLDGIYRQRIEDLRIAPALRRDMEKLYTQGGFTEKSLVLTVLCAIHEFL